MIYLKIEPFSFLGKENEYRVKVEAKAIYLQAREEIMDLLQTATKEMYTEDGIEFGLTSDAPIERHSLRFYQLAIEEINQEIKHPNLWISLDANNHLSINYRLIDLKFLSDGTFNSDEEM